jgi:proline iminopeptidase
MPTQLQHEGYVFTADVPIYCKSIGEGPPLVLLHGGPGSNHQYFLPWVLGLARSHRLVLIDQRGCGRSGPASDPRRYTLDAMVDDLETVRDALGLGRMALLGHSFGGLLAQAYAVRHAARLSHLVLVGTASTAKAVNADFARIRKALPARTACAYRGTREARHLRSRRRISAGVCAAVPGGALAVQLSDRAARRAGR